MSGVYHHKVLDSMGFKDVQCLGGKRAKGDCNRTFGHDRLECAFSNRWVFLEAPDKIPMGVDPDQLPLGIHHNGCPAALGCDGG